MANVDQLILEHLRSEGLRDLSAGQWHRARTRLEAAAEGRAADPALLLGLATACLHLRQPEAALERLNQLMEARQVTVHQLSQAAEAYAQLGRPEDALAALARGLDQEPGRGDLTLRRARLLEAQGRRAEAAEALTPLLPEDLDPSLTDLIGGLPGCDALGEAETDLLLRLSRAEVSAEALARMGHALKGEERWAEALRLLHLARTLKPAWGELLLEIGEVYFKLNRSEEGLTAWLDAQVLTPAWGSDLREPAQLEAAIRRYLSESLLPCAFPDVLVKLAQALIGAQRFEEAFALWERYFSLHPEAAPIHRRLTAAFHFCGRVAFADRIYQARVDWHNDQARQQQLDQLGVRFLRDFSTNVGHIGFLDQYVKKGMLGQRCPAEPVLVTGLKPVANPCYLDYWAQHLPRRISDPATYLRIAPMVDLLEDHTHGMMDAQGRQTISYLYGDYVSVLGQWDREGRGPLLTLSEADVRRGEERLRDLGVPEGAWFVCVHAREDAWDRVRNVEIDSYRLAMETICARGGWVIRMGDAGMTPMPEMPGVIDYARSPLKSDWMDVFLWARNRFFLGTASGPCQVPPTFGVPCVLTNWAPIFAPVFYDADICIYKRYFQGPEARELSFPELLSSPIGYISSSVFLARQGIRLQDNTAEEIHEAVVEMLDRLDGQAPPPDDAFQAAWKQCFLPVGGTNGRIGHAFARRHPHLLGL